MRFHALFLSGIFLFWIDQNSNWGYFCKVTRVSLVSVALISVSERDKTEVQLLQDTLLLFLLTQPRLCLNTYFLQSIGNNIFVPNNCEAISNGVGPHIDKDGGPLKSNCGNCLSRHKILRL